MDSGCSASSVIMECWVNSLTIKCTLKCNPQLFHDKFYHLIQGVTGDVFNVDEPQIRFGLYHLSNSNIKEDDTFMYQFLTRLISM